jgi:hypothetical protein
MMIDPCLTHIPILARCVSVFGGNVLEFGTGMGSSPLLCTMVDGELHSFESNPNWFISMTSGAHGKNLWTKPNHHIHKIVYNNWDSVYTTIDWSKHWSIAFIDHAPGERRIVDIYKLKDLVDVIIYHDSEEPSYGWAQLDGVFKWKRDFDLFPVMTTVVSNRVDLSVL